MRVLRVTTVCVTAVLCTAWAAAGQRPGPAAGARQAPSGYVFNIVDWEGGTLPPLYERSAQLPLSLEDVRELSAAKFADSLIVRMIQERRCACDASVGQLVSLKKEGVAESVIQALSLHALPPNRSLDLVIHMDFEGLGDQALSTQARKGYLYLIIPDGDRDRVFFGNLGDVLGRASQRGVAMDNTDILLAKQVRRVTFAARVPLKEHGPKQALVFTSTRPDIYTVADIPEADRQAAQAFAFDYPTSSLERRCSLQVLHRQDAMLANRWHLERSHFECEWE